MSPSVSLPKKVVLAPSGATIPGGIGVDRQGHIVGGLVAQHQRVGVTSSTLLHIGGRSSFSDDHPSQGEGRDSCISSDQAESAVIVNPDSQISTSVAELTFTTGDWSTPQMVTVTAMDDAVAEALHTGRITHSAASDDSAYNGLAIDDVIADISDNDSAGMTLAVPSKVA